MQGILEWGLGLVQTVQTIKSPALTGVMKAVSFLGSEWFYLAALPLIYWCVDRRRGLRLSLLFFFSAFLNHWLKLTLGQPRPYELDPAVGLSSETTHGLPSGHAQGTALFWGGSAKLFRRPWGLVLALAIPLLVGFSRVYLGVHFPTDVFAGWFLGACFVVVDLVWGDAILAYLHTLAPRFILLGAALLALVMNALDMTDTSSSGAFLGAAAGFVLAERRVAISTRGSLGQKLLRYLLGLAVTGLLYIGLKAAFPHEGADLYALFRFVRYGILTLWVALGAPWAFVKLGLAELEKGQAQEGEIA